MQQASRQIGIIAFVFAIYTAGWLATHALSHPVPSWTAVVDFCVTVPLVGAWLGRREPKRALRRALTLFGIGVLAARILLPIDALPDVDGLSYLRTFGIAVAALFELGAMFAIGRLLIAMRGNDNPETLIEHTFSARFGAGPVAAIFVAEARMWLHLLSRRREWKFPGMEHFSYHRRDGMQSLLLGFIIVMLLEIQFEHLLLNLWRPAVAWCVTIFLTYGVLWMIAHYRAVARRPISLETHRLVIRNGVLGDLVIPLDTIARIVPVQMSLDLGGNRRIPNQRRIGSNGNLLIEFREPLMLRSIQGARSYESVRFGADTPQLLIDVVNAHLVQLSSPT